MYYKMSHQFLSGKQPCLNLDMVFIMLTSDNSIYIIQLGIIINT